MAGVDQFGGEYAPELIVELVSTGRLQEERIDVSVRRILRDKYRLGLFDDPYLDEKEVSRTAGKEMFVEKGREAQARSMVLLKNKDLLPLEQGTRIYAEGVNNVTLLEKYGELARKPEDAQVILKRINTPFSEPRKGEFLERFFHQGRLNYTDEELDKIREGMNEKPTIVVVHLERPAILTGISEYCSALLGEFGTSDQVLSEVLFGIRTPQGKLPFELPSSPEAVEHQMEDVPYDSADPLYPYGFGLTYP